MKQNRIFERSRWQLASWYAGISSIILFISALGVYEAIAHAHRITIDQELKSVGGTLHDSLLPVLKQPGKLEPEVRALLPDTCLVATDCNSRNYPSNEVLRGDRFQSLRLGVVGQDKYYLRLFDLSKNLVAVAGIQPKSPQILAQQQWITQTDPQGIRYREIFFLLHTQQGKNWGYLQVGRSLQDVDRYIANVRWILLLGIPFVVLLVMAASWWLSGLAIRPIYQSYRQMQQFTADAAHELRTPLAAIQATAQSDLMLPTLSEKEARNTLNKIVRQNKRLSYLVADLLILCRIDGELSNKTSNQNQNQVVLADLIMEIEEELAALAMASEIELICQIKTSSLVVKGDRKQLYRLVTNLVTNAIQYTPAGGTVNITLTETNHHAVIGVRDTGIGIAKQEQKHIFDRFYRVDKARSRSQGGSGLGLSIAKAIAITHAGSLEVESELGQGSNFILRLPKDN